jgi:hypothetical protein
MSNTDTNPQFPDLGPDREATITHIRLRAAIGMIDDEFGIDYSKKNPNLVAVVLNALLQVK